MNVKGQEGIFQRCSVAPVSKFLSLSVTSYIFLNIKTIKKQYSAFSELFGYSFNKYLLGIYYVPGIVVGVVNKSNTSFYL